MEQMSVRLFSVHSRDQGQPLEAVLRTLQGRRLEDRLREVNQGQILRAEELIAPAAGKPYWLIDFTRLRFDHGPGKASATKPIEGFPLEENDAFGEEAAALYVPRSGHLLLQLNRFCVGRSGIQAYLSLIDDENNSLFEVVPAIDPSMMAKLARADIFTKLTVKVAPQGVSRHFRNHGVGIGRALEVSDQLNAPLLELTFSVGHTKARLNQAAVRGMITMLRRAIAETPDAIYQAHVSARNSEDEEAKTEVLDLLLPAVKVSFTDLDKGRDLRFTRASRFRALERAYAGWREHMRN